MSTSTVKAQQGSGNNNDNSSTEHINQAGTTKIRNIVVIEAASNLGMNGNDGEDILIILPYGSTQNHQNQNNPTEPSPIPGEFEQKPHQKHSFGVSVGNSFGNQSDRPSFILSSIPASDTQNEIVQGIMDLISRLQQSQVNNSQVNNSQQIENPVIDNPVNNTNLEIEQTANRQHRRASDYIVDENSDNYNEIVHTQFEPEEVDSEAIAHNKNSQSANSLPPTYQEEIDEDDDFQLLTSTVTGLLTFMSRPKPNTPSRTTTSTPGASRKPKSRRVSFINSGENTANALENVPANQEEDEYLELLTSTLGTVVTLMSRRQRPNVGSRTQTSQPGAVRIRKFGVAPVNRSTQMFHRLIQTPLKWLAIFMLKIIQKLIAKTPTTKRSQKSYLS